MHEDEHATWKDEEDHIVAECPRWERELRAPKSPTIQAGGPRKKTTPSSIPWQPTPKPQSHETSLASVRRRPASIEVFRSSIKHGDLDTGHS
ncbi:hypothetical protein MTO96_030531 [Rhipicephalus appendiculatus]